jgi:CO/xanthine dehydrogenase FAD-binding subunit
MITEYHRPKTINNALILLHREEPKSYPLGGGTVLNQGVVENIAVIDLQDLGLNKISKKGKILSVGATATLQDLLGIVGLPLDLYKSIELEATYNLRQMATIAGKLITSDGRSSLATAMLALNASIEIHELGKKPDQINIGDWLPIRNTIKSGKLITRINIPSNVQFAYEYIARTPADLTIVCSAVTRWESGRTRVALGGWGSSPLLVLDGPDGDGIEAAARNAYSTAGDEWASAEYRQAMAAVLSKRCFGRIIS